MDILIVGSGGREHALAWRFAASPLTKKVYVAPGNAGTEAIAENVPIAVTDIKGLVEFARENKIDFTVVGPEDPLALGIVDEFVRAGLRILGPPKSLVRIESSKLYAKDLASKLGIPTADYAVFTQYKEAISYLKKLTFPQVIKADGLALGKGVVVCHSQSEAKQVLKNFMVHKKLGDAGNSIVVESYLTGIELGVYVFSDGKTFHVLPPTEGPKPLLDGDRGPNTGGMGMVVPVPGITETEIEVISQKTVAPLLSYLQKKGTPFVGVLHPGIMLTNDGPKVLEYNVRPGGSDTQVYMRLIENDALGVYMACLEGALHTYKPKLSAQKVICVALVSGGYPGAYKKGLPISGLEQAAAVEDVELFHAGTIRKNGQVLTNGGRVLHITAVGETLEEAQEKAYRAAEYIHFEGMHLRHDIGNPLLRDRRT